MPLSNELVSDFVKLVKNNEKKASEETLYGTAVQYNDQIYVRLDGSDRITPVNTTTKPIVIFFESLDFLIVCFLHMIL